MKLIILRETLLKPLQLAASIAERRPSLPILANVLLQVSDQRLTVVGSDSEIELTGIIKLSEPATDGSITVPARKLLDICRSLPDKALITLEVITAAEPQRAQPLAMSSAMQQLKISCGRSKFLLATLAAEEFPLTPKVIPTGKFSIEQRLLGELLQQTHFAMAQQDVRHYLNGLLLELTQNQLNVVAADGHRLAISSFSLSGNQQAQLIIPRKAVLELMKLLEDTEAPVELILSANQLRVETADYVLVTKIIDSKFPDYQRVIPRSGDKTIVLDRDILKQTLIRTAILAHEKHRGVRLGLGADRLHVSAHNPEHEQAEEDLEISYNGKPLEIGFNVGYLIDVLNTVPPGKVTLTLTDENSSALIQGVNVNTTALYIIMPLRL